MPNRELEIEFNSRPEQLAMVRENIRNFSEAHRLSVSAMDDIELAVDEAVTNVVQHAYTNRGDGLIRLHAWKADRKLFIAIRDFGRGFKPKPVGVKDIRRIIQGKTRRGLGRYLMKQCMDSVRYKSVSGHYNETVMMKRLSR